MPAPAIATGVAIRHPLPYDPTRLADRVGGWDRPALLESVESGRWSILAARPRCVYLSEDGSSFRTESHGEAHNEAVDPVVALAEGLDRLGLANPDDRPDPTGPPFRGGLIGYLGYDLAPRFERLPRHAEPDSALPVLRFGLYDTFVVLDHVHRTAELWAVNLLDGSETLSEGRAERWRADLLGDDPKRVRPPIPTTLNPLRPDFDQDTYLERARRAIRYIEAGDVYQVNLSHRFTAQGSVDPLRLYQMLKRTSPAPFMAFLAWEEKAVVSASPETFYRTEGDRIVTRPIKGTRPRSADPTEDQALREALLSSVKDQAELTMIIDLERNDLGRVCRFGSVEVTDPIAVESYRQVHHLVGTIQGQLRPEVGPIDVVRALFPGGSITGAPKIRAMEIIDELEDHRRGVYTGAVGYWSVGGTSEFNIAIRTLTVEPGRVVYRVGGGVVADSTPEAEYLETLHKGAGLRAAIEACGRGEG